MADSYQILILKLDQFVKKYYKNQLIKGAIYCTAIALLFFLLANVIEYYGHFSTNVRSVIFFGYLALNGIIITRYILIPVFKLFRIGKCISHEEAAKIIGQHFSDVQDKLLNILQLKEMAGKNSLDDELIEAGINQKIGQIRPVPFQKAVDFSKNKKYLKYPVIPLILIFLIFIVAPGMITESAERIVNYRTYYEIPLPYSVSIENENLEAIQGDNFILKVKLNGEEIPEKLYVSFNQRKGRFQKETTGDYTYRINNVQESFDFEILSEDYKLGRFNLNVIPRPAIVNFKVQMDFPAYTNIPDKEVENTGDLFVPEGTNVRWLFNTQNANSLIFRFKDRAVSLSDSLAPFFNYNQRVISNQDYEIVVTGNNNRIRDSIGYRINSIPDLYPDIRVERYMDSVMTNRLFFHGIVDDDYGLKRLIFIIQDNEDKSVNRDTLLLQKNLIPQQFYYDIDIVSRSLVPGVSYNYFFEIWDNDAINGSKVSRSQSYTLEIPTYEEIENEKMESNKAIKDDLEQAIDDIKKLNKNVEQVHKDLINKEKISWEDKEKVKQLLEQQKEIKDKLEEIKNKNEEKANKEQLYKKVDQELIDKQKKLEELFEKLTENDELRKLFEKMQELMEELNKDELNKMLEDVKLSNEEMEEMLDRNLELFKQLEFEQKLEDTKNKLEELSKKQDNLSEETKNKDRSEEDISKEQKDIKDQFEQVKKDLDELDKMNEDLKAIDNLDDLQSDEEQTDESLENAEQQLSDGKPKKASESQKKAGDSMKKMANSLAQMQQEMVEEGMSEDMESLRSILENLVQISFDQENLMSRLTEINISDPGYVGLIKEQNDINEDLKLVKDSLIALSNRQIMIEPFITKEISTINRNVDNAIEAMNNRQTAQAASSQQYVMTSVNNLALMLSETLKQMQDAISMPSNSSCKNPGKPKPGGGRPSMQTLQKMQEQLNQQIESMKQGKKMGNKNDGAKSGKEGQSMSEQLARSAAQQEYIRNQLQEMAKQLDTEGESGASKELKKMAEEMEKTETDLVNKMITQETLIRQKEILTRLLKSDKARMEREKEQKRESKEGNLINKRNPIDLMKYNETKTGDLEFLRTVPPSFQPFYKYRTNQYFIKFEEFLKR